jgi:hypothetical protein
MTIQITRPEVETIINLRLETGSFRDAEEVILDALKTLEPKAQGSAEKRWPALWRSAKHMV